MSDARWFRNIRVEPHLVPAPGARITSSTVASLLLVADSLGERPILVVQISFTIDVFPDRHVTRNVSVDYRDEALFELYCDSTSDNDLEVSFLP